jgi:hypothetical protein
MSKVLYLHDKFFKKKEDRDLIIINHQLIFLNRKKKLFCINVSIPLCLCINEVLLEIMSKV